MAQKVFTNGKDDRPLTIELYRQSYFQHLSHVTRLDYATLSWGDLEAESLGKAIATGVFGNLSALILRRNQIGDTGLLQLVEAMRTPDVLPMLDNIDLSFNVVSSCLLYTSPSPRDLSTSRMPSSA